MALETGKTSLTVAAFIDAMTSDAEGYRVTCQHCEHVFVIHSLWITGIVCRGCGNNLTAYDISIRPLIPQAYLDEGWSETDPDPENYG